MSNTIGTVEMDIAIETDIKKRGYSTEKQLDDQGIKAFSKFTEETLGLITSQDFKPFSATSIGNKEKAVGKKFYLEHSFKLPNEAGRVKEKFESLQKWEGVVQQVDASAGNFCAYLTDITNGGTDEETVLTFDDLEEDDFPLVRTGAIFYWSIGYLTAHGSRTKSSLIRFKRSPILSVDERNNDILDNMGEIKSGINWE